MNDDALADANKQANGAVSNPLLKAMDVNLREKIFVFKPAFHRAGRAGRAMQPAQLCVCARIPKFMNFRIILLF